MFLLSEYLGEWWFTLSRKALQVVVTLLLLCAYVCMLPVALAACICSNFTTRTKLQLKHRKAYEEWKGKQWRELKD